MNEPIEIKTSQAESKKRYEPPAILSREPLEVMAALCSGGTAKTNPGLCPKGPINS
jgi:hypothetical protein